MTKEPSTQTVYPTLTYADIDEAVDFLTGTLGFTEHEVSRSPDGAIVHAELAWRNGLVMLSPAGDDASPFRLGPICLYLAVDDPDAHHERVMGAGAESVMGLTDQDYGSREFAVRDFEGNVWCFGTYQPVADRPAAGSR